MVKADAPELAEPDPEPHPEPTLKRKRGGQYATVRWLERLKLKKWNVKFWKNGKELANRCFATEEQAKMAKAAYEFDETIPPPKSKKEAKPGVYNKRGSVSARVYYYKALCMWTVSFRKNNKGLTTRKFKTQEEAERAKEQYEIDETLPPGKAENQQAKRISKWKGIIWSGNTNGGRWKVYCKGTYLGTFKDYDEEAAARAYNVEAKRIGIPELSDVPDAPLISKHDRFFKKG